MKNFKKLWAIALLLATSMVMFSCKEDDEPIIKVEEGLQVPDGYYFVQEGNEPVIEMSLLPEKVEGEGNAAVDRDGFYGNYVYLTAGDYELQKVESKEVTSTLGGSVSMVPLDSLTGEEPFDSYNLGLLTEGGAAISIANDGFFKVSYDETTTELILMAVQKVSFIGEASGWSDVSMDIVSSNPTDGFVFNTTGVTIRNGQKYKVRINNAWKIIRTNEAGNGYIAFTNYGGSSSNLVAGGADILFEQEDGVYSIEIELQNDGGAFIDFTKTGDAEVIVFDPADNQWAVVGAATSLGWPANNDCGAADQDVDMTYDGEINGAHTWSIEIELAADQFKFRKNDCWTGDLGYGGFATIGGPDAANFTDGGGNFANSVAGIYDVVMSTSDEGDTYDITFELIEETGGSTFDPAENQWAVVGAATTLGWPSNNDCGAADQDVDMTYDGVVDGAHTWTATVALTADEFKFRKNDCWDGDKGFGGFSAVEGTDAGNFSEANGNFACSTAGTYLITMKTADEGATYTVAFDLQ